MWKLLIEDDEGKRTVVPLTRDDYTIGRKEGNTIRLTERNVSRDHATLRKRNGSVPAMFTVEDATSYNGVYVNGLRVAETHDVTHGDLIQIGDYRIVLQDDAVVEAATPPLPDYVKQTIPSGLSSASTRGPSLVERPNRLVMLAGPTPGAEYPLDRDRLTVGRAEDASVSVNHTSVSRMHCEIHALGESRFEIVDKGSSNGVRVNGSDLRRGIVEAGDIIELGDVKFKFIGAGQIFLPGVTESQQLVSIGQRTASANSGSKRSSSGLIPLVLFGCVLGAVALGGWAYKQKKAAGNDTRPNAAQPENNEEMILASATKFCDENNCQLAHDKLTLGIAENSPLRQDDRFKLIEMHWADAMLENAAKEQDPMKKREMLIQVRDQKTVDESRQSMALSRLTELEPYVGVTPGVAPLAPSPKATSRDGGTRLATAVPSAERPARPTRVEPPTGVTHAVLVRPAPAPASVSAADKAREIMLNDPDAAKGLLMPRVAGGRATRDEIVLLKTICKNLHDQVCVSQCKGLLGE